VGDSGFFKKIIESRHGFQHILMLRAGTFSNMR